MNWINYLRADDPRNPLHQVFMNDHYSRHELMVAMDHFLRRRDELSIPRERGDRIAITLRGGDQLPHNLEKRGEGLAFRAEPKARGESFIRILAELTGWEYKSERWTWENWRLYQFTKGSLGGDTGRLNNGTFRTLMSKQPLSFAMTASNTIEYILEEPDQIV
ncbi:MAG: hypothetical protein HY741_14650 [Chloroflexi bacterium]|nr:hypothetical protein [Chloroflexota bacterium]